MRPGVGEREGKARGRCRVGLRKAIEKRIGDGEIGERSGRRGVGKEGRVGLC